MSADGDFMRAVREIASEVMADIETINAEIECSTWATRIDDRDEFDIAEAIVRAAEQIKECQDAREKWLW